METYGQRVRRARESVGWSQGRLAREIGLKQPSLYAIETHQTATSSKHTMIIARKTGVRPEWLESGVGEMLATESTENRTVMETSSSKIGEEPLSHRREHDRSVKREPSAMHGISATNDGPEHLLRVVGMAEGGPDGWNLFNGETVQFIDRPTNLRGVVGAYAVIVRGDSMHPKYDPGDIAHVNPAKRVEPGRYVLVQRLNPDDENRPFAVIKRLVRRTEKKLVLEQLNPPHRFELPTAEIVSIHRIVGSSEE